MWYWEILQASLLISGHLLVVTEQVKKVEAQNGVLFLRSRNNSIELVVVAAQDADVSLELGDVLVLNSQESCVLVDFPGQNALFGVADLTRRDVVELADVEHEFVHGVSALGSGLRSLRHLLEAG